MNNREKPRVLNIGEYQLQTCKWCYLQILPGDKKDHKECNKKKARVMHSRKRNLVSLEKSMDSRYPGRTSSTAIRVISAEGVIKQSRNQRDGN
jgi:hypothetical protein